MNIFSESIKYIKKFNKTIFKDYKRLILFVILIFIIMLSKQIFPLIMKFVIDDVLPNGKKDIFKIYIFVLLGAKILEFLSLFFSSILNVLISSKFILNLKLNFFKMFFKLKPGFIDSFGSGQIYQRLNNDTENIQNVIYKKFFNFFKDIIQLLILIPIIFYLNIKLTLMMFLFLPITVYGSIYFGDKLRKENREKLSKLDDLNSFALERIRNYRLVKYNSTEKFEAMKFYRLNKDYFRVLYKNALTQEFSYFFYKVSVEFIPILLFLYGGYLVFSGETTIGTVIAFLNFNTRFFYPVKNIFKFTGSLSQLINSFERYFEYFDENNFECSGDLIIDEIEGIEFMEVEFYYRKEKKILKRVNFKIEKNKNTAIVGKSGIGKSTIIDLLLGLYKPTKGKILVSGYDLNMLNIKKFRKRISIVTQEDFILNDSIKTNIVYDSESVSEDHFKNIIEIVCLKELIESLPDKENTIVGEAGILLSGGEKQRIAIARALLRDSQLYIFDEATSNIDVQTEKRIWKKIYEHLKGKTVLIIAHRLSTILDCDRIVVLSEGKVLENGSFQDLKNKDGEFCQMLKDGKILE